VKVIFEFSLYLPTYNSVLGRGGVIADIYGVPRKPSQLTLLAKASELLPLQPCVSPFGCRRLPYVSDRNVMSMLPAALVIGWLQCLPRKKALPRTAADQTPSIATRPLQPSIPIQHDANA
jgi:hypothetical protein